MGIKDGEVFAKKAVYCIQRIKFKLITDKHINIFLKFGLPTPSAEGYLASRSILS